MINHLKKLDCDPKVILCDNYGNPNCAYVCDYAIRRLGLEARSQPHHFGREAVGGEAKNISFHLPSQSDLSEDEGLALRLEELNLVRVEKLWNQL